MAAWWQRIADARLTQGDVFAEVPVSALVVPLTPLIKFNADWRPTDWKPDNEGQSHTLSKSRLATVVVVTHSCEVDKNLRRARVAVVGVGLRTSMREEDWTKIETQRSYRNLPLPAIPTVGDGYADFRVFQSIPAELLPLEKRVGRLSEGGRTRLLAQLFAYFARIEPDVMAAAIPPAPKE